MSFLSNLLTFNKKSSKIDFNEKKNVSGKCPYCESEINPAPAKKKKCPTCGEDIIVRTHYKSKEKVLLTVLQATKFDIEKEKYYAVTSFLRGLGQFGIEKHIIDNLVSRQTEVLRQKFGKEPSFADVAWGVSNQLIIKYPDLSQGIHFQQAIFLHKEDKDPTKIRLIDFEKNLKEYQKSDFIKGVKVITAGEQSCEHCRKLENITFTIQEALEKELLPCKECSFDKNKKGIGWCRCCYGAEF